MEKEYLTFINKLSQNGPIVLLLGQNFRLGYSNNDYLLQKISNRFKNFDDTNNYSGLFDLDVKDKEDFYAWLSNISEAIVPSMELEFFSQLSLSHIFTSSIDASIDKLFKNANRAIQPVYDDKFTLLNPRDQFRVHLSFLYGSINQKQLEYIPPLNKIEKNVRDLVAIKMLNRLKNILTPTGILLVDGYNLDNDWLDINNLHSQINTLYNKQTYVFGLNSKQHDNIYIQDLVKNDKITVFKETLGEIVGLVGIENISISEYHSQSQLGHWIKIGRKYYEIPNSIWAKTSKSAIIIDDDKFSTENVEDNDLLYSEFRKFLSNSSPVPYWEGYKYGFAIKREFYSSMFALLVEKLKNKIFEDEPIVVHGQSSVGKTISLGQLAYEVYKNLNKPVLFIERRYYSPSIEDIDSYLNWIEGISQEITIVIWDGMEEIDKYYEFIKKLNARGRKFILICSAYKIDKQGAKNFILVDPVLTNNEVDMINNVINRFTQRENGIKLRGEENFLSLLYRYLPPTRALIQQGLNREKLSIIPFIELKISQQKKIKTSEIAEQLLKLGLISQDHLDEISTDVEKFSVAEDFIYYIMVASQFGLNVPIELFSRCLGLDKITPDYIQFLNTIDIIRINDDSLGNIYISGRNAFEASLLVKTLGGKEYQLDYILKLIENCNLNYFNSQIEIEFIVSLLYYLSPNVTKSFLTFYPRIISTLEKIREIYGTYNQRLILKEASFIREYVSKYKPENLQEYFNKAEVILRKAIDDYSENKNLPLYKYLEIELAALLGTKLVHTISYPSFKSKSEALQLFNLINHTLKKSGIFNCENYHALDVLAWSSISIIESDYMTSSEAAETLVSILNLYDMMESQGVREDQVEKFYEKKYKLTSLFKNEELQEKIITELSINRPELLIYLQVRKILQDVSLNESFTENCFRKIEQAFLLLEDRKEIVQKDHRLLYLYFKLWWNLNAKTPVFENEKKSLAFVNDNWERCIEIIDKLLSLDELYALSSLKYIKALSLFHLKMYKPAISLFAEVDSESDLNLPGRKRIIKYFYYSDENGKAKLFDGTSESTIAAGDKFVSPGKVFIPELKISIPFLLKEFNLSNIRKGEILEKFYIAFSFRGPIATQIIPTQN